ncbi:CRISPR-associated exonuclease, Cas4 family [Desulfocicer vacuolatum DSM 3385]|uniref:CRISPR-associated exonuclease Cas4 n=2 Tax=Desulfocicer vacuolatum TaxID=2298 RepID=A0A1W2EYG9_9BACT|nr:CRISPR-associated exonuclease, Cas4 family [Desulfocicer vacuolatum DSM 3385]
MSKYNENEYISLSALQHMLFCERQCALIHIEQLWVENKFTAEGRVMHERVDRGDHGNRGKTRVEYSLPLKSRLLGITGKADVVEFNLQKGSKKQWIPFPLEYKRGKPKQNPADKVQLCAQALCLEEMLNLRLEKGALFYGKTRRRQSVVFDDKLRQLTIETAKKIHVMIDSGITPAPHYEKKCDTCSFLNLCLPKAIEKSRKVSAWLERIVHKELS